MIRLPAALRLSVALVVAAGSAAVADDSWNPFRERDKARAERGGRASPAAPGEAAPQEREPLSPMDGVARRPWLDERREDGRLDGWSGRSGPGDGPREADEGRQDRRRGLPGPGTGEGPVAAESVQRIELAPIAGAAAAPVASPAPGREPVGREPGLGALDADKLEEAIAGLTVPPRSAAMAHLWRGLWAQPAGAGGRDGKERKVSPETLRLEVLYRSGLADELGRALASGTGEGGDAIHSTIVARSRIALGEQEAGCADIKGLQKVQRDLPKPLRAEFLTLAAYCGAASRDAGKAGLAGDLMRTEGVEAPVAIAALDALAGGGQVKLTDQKRIGAIDYRFIELAAGDRLGGLAEKAEPLALAVMARGTGAGEMRAAAAEAALAQNILTPGEAAAIFRAVGGAAQAADEAAAEKAAPALRRAAQFKAIEAERTPMRKARMARALLDDVRRAGGSYMQTAAMLGDAVGSLAPAPEMSWFAETAIEILLAAGRYEAVRAWAEPPAAERYGGLRHWLVLADIGDATRRGRRGEDLAAIEQFAVRGRLSPALMHKLATVLDALDYQIPIPLWEAASRTPQPTSGHLPATGVLSQLQDSAKQGDRGRVVLAGLQTLGPDAAEGAHMIALGDVIRALKRAGLEAEARRLGLEALWGGWPRSANN